MPFLHPGKFHLNFLSALHHSKSDYIITEPQCRPQNFAWSSLTHRNIKRQNQDRKHLYFRKWLGQTSLCNSFIPKVKTLKLNGICIFSGLKHSWPTSVKQIQLKSYLQDTLLCRLLPEYESITSKGVRGSDSPFIGFSFLHPFLPLWWWFAMWFRILAAVRWGFWPSPSFLNNQNEINVKCRVLKIW